jgi:hypothetical protein
MIFFNILKNTATKFKKMELEQLQTERLIIKLYFPKDLDHIFENFSEEEIKFMSCIS